MDEKPIYNYPHFKLKYFDFENFVGPKIDELAPDFTARTLDDRSVKLSDYLDKPVVLSSGSITCPVYISKINAMNALQEQFAECHFLVLYTRETHPGSRIPPHRLLVDKVKQAKHLASLEKEKRTILVDDIDGIAHQLYGGLPNFCYIIGTNGAVYYRAEWELPKRIEAVLKQLQTQPDHLDFGRIEALPDSFHTPLTKHFHVMHRAGMRSLMDFLLAVIFEAKLNPRKVKLK